MQRQAISLITALFSLSIVACSSLPEKPMLEICVLDVPAQEGMCGFPKGSNFRTSSDAKYDQMVYEIKSSLSADRFPLAYLDKAIALRPYYYQALVKYVAELEKQARKSCASGSGFND